MHTIHITTPQVSRPGYHISTRNRRDAVFRRKAVFFVYGSIWPMLANASTAWSAGE